MILINKGKKLVYNKFALNKNLIDDDDDVNDIELENMLEEVKKHKIISLTSYLKAKALNNTDDPVDHLLVEMLNINNS